MVQNGSKEDRIRHRAYRIWVEEGCPQGRDKEHWEQAEKIISREDDQRRDNEQDIDPAVVPKPGP